MPIDLTGPPAEKNTRMTEPPESNRGGGGSRFGMSGGIPRRNLSHIRLDEIRFWELDPLSILDIAVDIFPDVGMAIHNILRLGNPGHEIRCRNMNTEKPDSAAEARCYAMEEKANRGVDCSVPGAMGGSEALYNSLFISDYTRGASSTETVLTKDLSDLDDIAYVNPFSIEFEEIPGRPGRYKIFQLQNRRGRSLSYKQDKIELNPLLITYVPADDTLYGRIPMAPALQVLPYWLRFWMNLQVFLHGAAFGNIDASLKTDMLRKHWDSMSPDQKEPYKGDFTEYVLAKNEMFANDFERQGNVRPDGARFHPDWFELTMQGTARSVYPVDQVQKVCEKEIFKALKMLPIFMGSNESTTETHGTIQQAIQVSGLKHTQGRVKRGPARAMKVGLIAQGYRYAQNTSVDIFFNEVSLEDRQRASEAAVKELDFAIRARDENFISQDEASQHATGTNAIGGAPGSGVEDQSAAVKDVAKVDPLSLPLEKVPQPKDGQTAAEYRREVQSATMAHFLTSLPRPKSEAQYMEQRNLAAIIAASQEPDFQEALETFTRELKAPRVPS